MINSSHLGDLITVDTSKLRLSEALKSKRKGEIGLIKVLDVLLVGTNMLSSSTQELHLRSNRKRVWAYWLF